MDDRLRVLVVEDNADQALLVRNALRRHTPPMDVTLAATARECLDALSGPPYSAIVLDHHLPGTSGLELLRTIEATGTGRPPVVMVTGQGDERIAVEAMKAGAADYVIKTVGYFASLPTAIVKAVRQHQLTLENARLDREARRRLRETEGLLAVAEILGATLDRDELARRATRELRGLLEADGVAFCAVDPATTTIRPHVECGRLARVDDAELTEIHRTLVSGEPVQRPLRSASRVWVPVGTANRCFGALLVSWPDAGDRDVTDGERLASGVAKQLALALERARLYEETQEALAEVGRAQEHLVRSHTLRALGEMAAGTAHHLNNLLAVALGHLQLMRRRMEVSNGIRSAVDTIEQSLRDAASVVRRMQGFARTSPSDEHSEPIDLHQIAQDVHALTETPCVDEFQARGIPIQIRVEAERAPVVRAHPGALREVVTNLILNAADAMPRGGLIVLRTFERDGRACLSVRDTGVGMSAAVKERAFEPFFTTKGPKGTGLGLSVAYGVIRRHGGELEIDSAEGVGTTVTLSLPPLTGSARRRSTEPPEPAETPGPTIRVLLVDDDDRVRALLGELLQADGHCVLQARSGAESLAVLERGVGVDLVLTDHGMPGMTGLDLTRTIKRRWPALRVGLITGWAEDLDVPADQARPDFILAKPVDAATLRAAVGTDAVLATA